MFYLKLILIVFLPMLVFGQNYYTEESQNSFSELALNKNRTFSYTEEGSNGDILTDITGTYKISEEVLIGYGWDSVTNSKVKLEIYVESDSATVSISGRKEKILTEDYFD